MLKKVDDKFEARQPTPKRKRGRPKGSKNKRTVYREAAIRSMLETQQRKGGTPLDYMLNIMSDPNADERRRDDMAKAAARYVHPTLQSVENTGEMTLKHEDALDELE